MKFVHTPEEEGAVVEEFLIMEAKPTALVISTPLQGVGVLKALHKRGVHVPDEISLVVFNKTLITEMSIPVLTSIDTEAFQLGYEASRGVVELINNPDTFKRSVIIPAKIEPRESHRKLTKDNSSVINVTME